MRDKKDTLHHVNGENSFASPAMNSEITATLSLFWGGAPSRGTSLPWALKTPLVQLDGDRLLSGDQSDQGGGMV